MYCSWERKIIQPFWETVWQYLKELNIHLSYDLAILLLGITRKEHVHTKICMQMFIAVLVLIALDWKQPNKCVWLLIISDHRTDVPLNNIQPG